MDCSFATEAEFWVECLYEALQEKTDNVHYKLDRGADVRPPVTWPSSIRAIDGNEAIGGFYGFTSITGFGGLGKSLLALASCLEASGGSYRQVVHFVSENDLDDLEQRVNIYMDLRPELEEGYATNYYPVGVGLGQTPASLAAEVVCTIDMFSGVPWLVCVDSVNSVVNKAQGGYLAGLTAMGTWMAEARRLSSAGISFISVNEANKQGGAKGGGPEYIADVDLRLRPVGESKKVVLCHLEKTRRTPEVEIGHLIRKNDEGRFLDRQEVEDRQVPLNDLDNTSFKALVGHEDPSEPKKKRKRPNPAGLKLAIDPVAMRAGVNDSE